MFDGVGDVFVLVARYIGYSVVRGAHSDDTPERVVRELGRLPRGLVAQTSGKLPLQLLQLVLIELFDELIHMLFRRHLTVLLIPF